MLSAFENALAVEEAENAAAYEACGFLMTFTQRSQLIASGGFYFVYCWGWYGCRVDDRQQQSVIQSHSRSATNTLDFIN